jgi:hypothetical protein
MSAKNPVLQNVFPAQKKKKGMSREKNRYKSNHGGRVDWWQTGRGHRFELHKRVDANKIWN